MFAKCELLAKGPFLHAIPSGALVFILFLFFSFSFLSFFSFFPLFFLFISKTIQGPSGPPWGPGPYNLYRLYRPLWAPESLYCKCAGCFFIFFKLLCVLKLHCYISKPWGLGKGVENRICTMRLEFRAWSWDTGLETRVWAGVKSERLKYLSRG